MAIARISRDHLFAVGAGLVAFAMYAWTAAPDMLPGDSAEFQFAVPLLGIVHPTGYPLYLLLAKVFTFLPVGTVAYRVNLFSAVCAALTVAIFYAVLDRSLQSTTVATAIRRALASAGAVTLASAPTFWAQATRAEVYALNTMFVAALLWLATEGALTAWPRSGAASAVPTATANMSGALLSLSALIGLSLAHHRTTLLLLPALAVATWGWRIPPRTWLTSLVLVTLPLAFYLYTPLRYDASPYTRIGLDEAHVITTLERSAQAFIGHALGSNYGGAVRWDEVASARLLATPARIAVEFGGAISGWAAVAMAVAGYVLMTRTAHTRAMAGTIGVAIATFVGFNAIYHIGDIADYYTPVYALVVWSAIWGLAALTQRGGAWAVLFATVVAWTLPAWLVLSRDSAMPLDYDTRRLATTILNGAPADAILISNDRDEMTPLFYLQLVDGMRTDVAPLFPLITPSLAHVVPLTRYALETRRAVFFVKEMQGLETVFQLERQGSLVRVKGAAAEAAKNPINVESAAARLQGWSARYTEGRAEVTLFWQAASAVRSDFSTYVHLVNVSGMVSAQSDHVPGGVYYPPSQWAAGENIRDVHRLTLGSAAPPQLRLVVGAYGSGEVEGVRRVDAGTIRRDD